MDDARNGGLHAAIIRTGRSGYASPVARAREGTGQEARGRSAADRVAARPELSVVVPAFNQADTIRANLSEIVRRLEAQDLDFELIVVSDGSSDDTHAESVALDHGRVAALRYDRNMGKGYALRTGSRVARGRWIAWLDSDLDLDPARVGDFLDRARRDDLDVVVGSKRHPDSEVSYPSRRRVYSWLYQQLVRAMFSLDVRDTQVGMKLFRHEVLDEVLPVVLVKRYAFDLEILAVARSFGFPRIAEAPVRLDYQFAASGVDWRAIAHALWDTGAIFYRLRLRRFYEHRRVLAHRVAVHRPDVLPGLTVVLVPDEPGEATRRAVVRLRAATPPGTRVVVVARETPDDVDRTIEGAVVVAGGAGSRSDRIGRILHHIDTEVVAFVDQDAQPSDGWAAAALELMGDAHVGAVVGPTVPRLGASDAHDAAGILSESRLGVGGARIRHHVGQLREVGDFPASNLFVRTEALRRAVDAGQALDDDLCRVLRSHHGLQVLCSPDVVMSSRPLPLFRPYVGMLHRLGRDRGESLRDGWRPRLRHLVPVALVGVLATGPAAVRSGGRLRRGWTLAIGAYGATLACFGGIVMLLHRRPRLAGLTMAGAVASHLAFGAGIVRGAVGGLARRRLER